MLLLGAVTSSVQKLGDTRIPQFNPIQNDRKLMLDMLKARGIKIPPTTEKVAAQYAEEARKKMADPQG
jgi:hypothetical protein